MKTAFPFILVIFFASVGLYWWTTSPWSQGAAFPGPSATLGTTGSPNQGNLGRADTVSRASQGDGTGVKDNLILGINGDPRFGRYLSAYNGMTVYTYAKDVPGTTNCYDTCAANWPPYTIAPSDPINVPSSIPGEVSTIMRIDGKRQVTYRGMPLYFWKGDEVPGDTTGQGVGGIWDVAKP